MPKEKGVTCRFNAPWPHSTNTIIACETESIDSTKLVWSKLILDIVLSTISSLTEKELLEIAGVSEDDYYEAVEYIQKIFQ